jgi:Domain of unknown function (DUF4129)
MTSDQKKKAMVFMGLCVIITALLAASLSQMKLQPGLPSPSLEGFRILVPVSARSDPVNLPAFPFILRFLGILLVLYFLGTLFILILGVGRKKLLRTLLEISSAIGIFVILILVLFLLRNPAKAPSAPMLIELPIFSQADSPPAILTWLVGVSLALLATVLFLYWIRFRRKSNQGDRLAEQIEKARQNIYAGMKLDDVILRCYQEMGMIIQREGGIERQVYTTPTEYEYELCSAGLPQAPVHELTHLFESVRYGRHTPTPADEKDALSNLQEIIVHLRMKKARQT